jgi:hypothetical protein
VLAALSAITLVAALVAPRMTVTSYEPQYKPANA